MSAFKEIVAKAVIGKGKKYFKNSYTIKTENTPTTVLGCWVINHKFKGYKTGEKIGVDGSYDINIWYSYDNDSKTTVVNNFRPAEKIDVPNIENSVNIYDLTEDDSNTITNNILNDNALVNFIERVIEIVNKDIDYIDETDYDMEEEVYNY